jgi:hypothetical protein
MPQSLDQLGYRLPTIESLMDLSCPSQDLMAVESE